MGLCFCSREPHHNGILSIVKAKCFGVICKKVDEAVDDDVAWPCGGVMSIILHNNVFLGFVRGPLTHDPGAPPVASQHNFIVQPLVTKEWNARAF